jgi:hypothetical protein
LCESGFRLACARTPHALCVQGLAVALEEGAAARSGFFVCAEGAQAENASHLAFGQHSSSGHLLVEGPHEAERALGISDA